MARKNKKGNSFGGLGLTKDEETKLKKYLKDNDNMSLKRFLRHKVRTHDYKTKVPL
jgi:hypothetical protein